MNRRNLLMLFGIVLSVLLVSQLNTSFLNLLAGTVAVLLSNLAPKDLFERCAAIPFDHVAWKDFFERYNNDIEATVRRIIGYPGQGRYCYLFEDLMQRFYQRLLENDRRALHALRGVEERQAHSYLRTIAAGVTYKMIHGEHPSDISLDSSEAEDLENGSRYKALSLREPGTWTEEALVLLISMNAALKRILRGRNKYRNMLIFKLVALDGFSPKELSAFACFRMKSRHAVEQLVSRTRYKLREALNR